MPEAVPLLAFRPEPGAVTLDLERLVTTRLLVQANSGGGKSWALRYLLEGTHGQIQQLVFDYEGEFATLRERFDYVLAGREGDVPADPRTAKVLCRRLMELHASAVLDLSDLSIDDRKLFVQHFLEALMHLPRALWRPVLVALDEAHVFCPERGEGEACSKQAVENLTSQGRKRGYCAVLATQRIAKVSNNALADLVNMLIGPTTFEPDVKRAGDQLGFDKAQREQLKLLDPGTFFARGPAISRDVVLVRTGPVRTTHPEPGAVAPPVPPPPNKIRALLGQLQDLPARAQEELQDLEAARARIAELEQQLASRSKAEIVERVVEVPAVSAEDLERLRQLVDVLPLVSRDLQAVAERVATAVERVPQAPRRSAPPATERRAVLQPVPAPTADDRSSEPSEAPPAIKAGGRRMLQVLAAHRELRLTRARLATLARMRASGGTFSTYLSNLKRAGFLVEEDGVLQITPAGFAELGAEVPPAPQTTEELLAQWRAALKGGAWRMLDRLVAIYPRQLTRHELARWVNLAVDGGTFSTYLSTLKTNGLVDVKGDRVRASETLFLADGPRRSVAHG